MKIQLKHYKGCEMIKDESLEIKMYSCDDHYTDENTTDMAGEFIKDVAEELRSYKGVVN